MGELVMEFVLRVFLAVVLYPALIIVGSPFIWIFAWFGQGTYVENVWRGYAKVGNVWVAIMDGS